MRVTVYYRALLVLVLLVLLCALECSGCTVEIRKPKKIRGLCGQVLYEDGTPAASATVKILRRSSDDAELEELLTSTADDRGNFSAPTLPKGTYIIRVKAGSESAVADVIVVKAKLCTRSLVLTMEPSAGCGIGHAKVEKVKQ